jgi:hypothetical protein
MPATAEKKKLDKTERDGQIKLVCRASYYFENISLGISGVFRNEIDRQERQTDRYCIV